MRNLARISGLVALLAAPAAGAGDVIMVAHKWDDSIGFYDSESGALLKLIPAGLKPHEIEITPDRRIAYVTNYGVDLYTDKSPGANTISIIDVRRREKTGEIDLGKFRRPHGIHLGRSGRIYATCDFPPSLLIVDPQARKVLRAFDVEQQLPHMVAVREAEDKAYTANSGSGSVTVIDLGAGKVVKQIKVDGVPMGMAWGPAGRRLYVTNRTDNAVAVIDPASGELIKKIRVKGHPVRVALAPDGNSLVVTLIDSGEAAVVDLGSEQEKLRFRCGARVEGLAIDPRGFLYTSAQADNKVVKFSLNGWKRLLEIPTKTRPDPIVILPPER